MSGGTLVYKKLRAYIPYQGLKPSGHNRFKGFCLSQLSKSLLGIGG